MMWISIAVLTALAILSVLWPLAYRRAGAAPADADRAFYEAQVSEIERDLGRGVLSESDAASAKAEAARRLIARHVETSGQTDGSTRLRRMAAALALLAVPGIGLGLYLNLGSPHLPDRPLASRSGASNDIFAAVGKIEKHLEANPDDARGWEVVAPVYLRTGRAQDAARAWGNVIRLAGPSPDRLTALGEALVFADQGKVNGPALRAFEMALELDASAPQPRFYTGLAAEQAGDKERARGIWMKLLEDAPPDAAWVAPVRARIAGLGPQVKVPAPDELAARTITALPKEDQQVFIAGMVDRLAARLKDNAKDPEGWLMLVNAYTVMKQPDKAREALTDARKALEGDKDALDKLGVLARQLGLEG